MIQTDIKLVCDGPFCNAPKSAASVFPQFRAGDGERQLRNLAWMWGWRRVKLTGALSLDLCPYCVEERAKQ